MKRFFYLAAILWIGLPAASLWAQRPKKETITVKSSPQLISAFKPINDLAAKSTVRVLIDGKDAALGTIVTSDGHILSKASELREGKLSVKLNTGKTYDAAITCTNDVFDLAMLKVNAGELTPIVWNLSRNTQVGNWVAAVSPETQPVAVGVVSVGTRELAPPYGRTLVPTEKTGFLGVSLGDEAAATVARVETNSAAEKAGLKPGDVILKVEGQEITNAESLINTLLGMKAGEKVTILIERSGKRQEIVATLGARPKEMIPKKNRGDFQNSMGSTLSERRTGFPTILQHDLVLKPSDCGGPLIDLDGRILGINIARAGRVESYAIPSESIMCILPTMLPAKVANNPTEVVNETTAYIRRLEMSRTALEKAISDAKKKLETARGEEKWWKEHPKEKGPEPRVVPAS